jgi:hypothetical protein
VGGPAQADRGKGEGTRVSVRKSSRGGGDLKRGVGFGSLEEILLDFLGGVYCARKLASIALGKSRIAGGPQPASATSRSQFGGLEDARGRGGFALIALVVLLL